MPRRCPRQTGPRLQAAWSHRQDCQAHLTQTRWESLLGREGRAAERAERLRNGRSGHASPRILQAAGGRGRSRRGLGVPSEVQSAHPWAGSSQLCREQNAQ